MANKKYHKNTNKLCANNRKRTNNKRKERNSSFVLDNTLPYLVTIPDALIHNNLLPKDTRIA